jgi:hypothetical protein
MASASMFTQSLFVAVVACVAALWLLAARRTAPAEVRARRTHWTVVLGVLVFYLAVPAVLASAGMLDRYAPLPTPGFILFGLLTLGTVLLALSPFGARLATGIPLAALVGYQAFRVPLEWALHQLYSQGVIPVQMTYSGRNFDVVTGLLAALLAVLLWSGRRPLRTVLAWNLLGLVLLANIVAIALLSMPVPFRQFMNDPANLLPGTFPFVWLPTFLVQAALFGHLLVFRALRSTRGT